MAHKKGGGTARINKDSISKRLGVKRYGGEKVESGNIIVRQKGNRVFPGLGVQQGNDYTVFAIKSGKVEFKKRQGKLLVSVI